MELKAVRSYVSFNSVLNEDWKMGKYKQHPKYNVLSIRVSDEEKALLDEMRRRDRSSITDLIRKAIANYAAFGQVIVNHS